MTLNVFVLLVVRVVCLRLWMNGYGPLGWELCLVFFFQAEDGIRDLTVTGVQTCALPICLVAPFPQRALRAGGDGRLRDAGGARCPACCPDRRPGEITRVVLPEDDVRQK